MESKIAQVATLILSICLTFGFAYIFQDHYFYDSVTRQVSDEFPVIYIDPMYSISIGGVCAGLSLFIAIVLPIFFSAHKKQIGITVLLMMIFSAACFFVVQPIERDVLIKQAARNGYVECPLFTLTKGQPSMKAMTLNFEYCFDKHIQKLSEYGYVSNLPEIKNYVKDAYSAQ